MATKEETTLDKTMSALTTFRKAMQETEEARSAATALLRAAARGDEQMLPTMAKLVSDAVQKLASKVAALQVSMDLVVKATAPETSKPAKAA